MTATPSKRALFISSLKDFMSKHGFQGVEVDWRFPESRKFELLVSLIKEMRSAYGTQYGISVTIAPYYTVFEFFNGRLLDPYVDFFDFLTLWK